MGLRQVQFGLLLLSAWVGWSLARSEAPGLLVAIFVAVPLLPVAVIQWFLVRSRVQVSSELVRVTVRGVMQFEGPRSDVTFVVPRVGSSYAAKVQLRHGDTSLGCPWCHAGDVSSMEPKLRRLGLSYELVG